jgi:PST family polysaccharide transporter
MLGYYEKSYRLMMLPLQTITHVVSPVMHPIFSDYQNDFKKLSDSYLKIVKLLAYIGFPLSVLLFFTSKELVLLIFGMQWERSILSFQILALSVGFEIILSTSGSIFQAANSTKMLFICGLISTIILIIAILIGVFIFKIIEAVALFSLFAFIINFIITYFLMYSKLFKTGLQTFFKVLISPIILSLILIFILYFTDLLFVNLNLLLQLIIKAIITLIACLLFIDIFKVYNTKDVFIRVFKKKFK